MERTEPSSEQSEVCPKIESSPGTIQPSEISHQVIIVLKSKVMIQKAVHKKVQ